MLVYSVLGIRNRGARPMFVVTTSLLIVAATGVTASAQSFPARPPKPTNDADAQTDARTDAEAQPLTPAERAQLEQARSAVRDKVIEARRALASRQYRAAQSALQEARVVPEASEAQVAEIDRLIDLSQILLDFWGRLRARLGGMAAAQEITINDKPAAFVEFEDGILVVRAAGRNRRWPLVDAPTSVLLGIADLSIQDGAEKDVVVGAFLLVDASGDPNEGAGLWKRAMAAGEDIDHLMPEIEEATRDHRLPPPQDAALAKADERVRAAYKTEFASARTEASQVALAKRLLEDSEQMAGDKDGRFTMYTAARDLAIEAGDLMLAAEAVAAAAEKYQVDAIDEKRAILAASAEADDSVSNQRLLARAALQLLREAIDDDRLDLAPAILDLALQAARGSRNRNLMQEVVAAQRYVEQLQAKENAR